MIKHCAFLLLCCAYPALADFSSADLHFADARNAMKTDIARGRALYEAAALTYLSTVQPAGPGRGIALYNAGNAFALAGQPGRAIACYRRASRDLPAPPFLADNLAQVRRQAGDTSAELPPRGMLAQAMAWHRLHWGLRLAMAAASYLLIWGLLISHQWRGGAMRRSPLLGAALLLLLLTSSLLHTCLNQSIADEGVVIVRNIEARKGDGYGYAPAFLTPLASGTEFSVEEIRGTWLRVTLSDGAACWLPREAVDLF